jgi:hypothetical protein
MDKGCNCASYTCDCYKPNDLPAWKEEDLLQCLWQIEACWDTNSIKTKNYCKEFLEKAIKICIDRGRKINKEIKS